MNEAVSVIMACWERLFCLANSRRSAKSLSDLSNFWGTGGPGSTISILLPLGSVRSTGDDGREPSDSPCPGDLPRLTSFRGDFEEDIDSSPRKDVAAVELDRTEKRLVLSVKAVLTVCVELRLIPPLDLFVPETVPETLPPKANVSPPRPDRDAPMRVREIASSLNMAGRDLVLAVGVVGRDTAPVPKVKSPN
jgi:hypothetical protein